MIWEKDSVHDLQLLFITRYGWSPALRAHHITAASGAVAWTLYVQLSSEFSGNHCTAVETNAAGEGMGQPGSRSCWSRRETAVLKSQLKIKDGSALGSQLALGLGVQDSCQKAKLASGDGTGATAYSCGEA